MIDLVWKPILEKKIQSCKLNTTIFKLNKSMKWTRQMFDDQNSYTLPVILLFGCWLLSDLYTEIFFFALIMAVMRYNVNIVWVTITLHSLIKHDGRLLTYESTRKQQIINEMLINWQCTDSFCHNYSWNLLFDEFL